MATQEANVAPAILVAKAFVESYYLVLYSSPDIVHKFYEDSSTITRPTLTDGEMSSASTMLGIKEMILSLDYHSCKAQIASIDAQESCNKGILVLVTGFLIGEGEVKRSFTQNFFLAKHAKGYFVLNDIFKFGSVIEEEVADVKSAEEVTETEAVVTEVKQESAQVPDQEDEVKPSESVAEEVKSSESVAEKVNSSESVAEKVAESVAEKVSESVAEKVSESVAEKVSESVAEKVSESVAEKVKSASPKSSKKASVDKKGPVLKPVVVTKQPSPSSQMQSQEPPKMSYASMLKKESPVTSPVKRMVNPVVVVAPSANSSLDIKEPTPLPPQPAPPVRRNTAQPSGDILTDGKGIYVGNLPPNIPAGELEKTFKQFGPIRKDGIQIRTYEDGFCYGFVEFESPDSARKAIDAHDFWFGMYKSYVTEKRSSGQGGNSGNMRQGQAKGEFRNFDNNRRNRENSVEGHRDYQNRGGEYGQTRGPYNNNNRNNNSQFQNRRPNEFSNQNRRAVY